MELTEFEEKFTELVQNHGVIGSPDLWVKFLSKLREIMPPTCTATERKFLDEIRELYEWNDHLGFPHLQRKEITKYSNIYQQDFKKTNLRELVNE